jgi:hypothetical protein
MNLEIPQRNPASSAVILFQIEPQGTQRTAEQLAKRSSASSQKAYHRHKQGRADYRPNDWEALAADMYEEEMGQVQCIGKPYSYYRADESQCY